MSRQDFQVSRFLVALAFLFVLIQTIPAQNIRIGSVDQGSSYTIGSGATNQKMTFTTAGATATAGTSTVWTGQIVMEAAGTIAVTTSTTASSTTTFAVDGGISGSGALTKSGNGIFLLNSASSQTGETIITGGTFQAGKNRVFSPNSAFSISSGTLDLNDTVQEIASLTGGGTVAFGSTGAGSLTTGGDHSDTIYGGAFTGTGTLTKVGAGFMVLGGSASSAVDLNVVDGMLFVNGYFGVDGGTASVADGAVLGGSGTFYDVNVASGGFLAPGTRTSEDVTSTSTLTVNNDLTLDAGSTLSIRVDDAGNSDNVVVGGAFTNVDDNANLEIYAIAGEYADPQTYDSFLVDFSGTNIANFNTGNISVAQKFFTFENVTENPNSVRLTRIPDYFTRRAQTDNQGQVATVFDQTESPVLWWAMTNMSNMDQADIDEAYHELSGEVKANSMMLGQWRTSRYGMNHLDMTPDGMKHCGSLWLECIHETTDFDFDGNSRGYGISRTGAVLGSEERVEDCWYGMLIGYSKPFLYSNGDKYEATDLQFGFYGGTYLLNMIETKMFIGVGAQEYDTRRFLRSPALSTQPNGERINGDYTGNSMSMSLEFAAPFDFAMLQLRPLIALDSDLSWQFPFTETGDTGFEQQYDRGFFDRTFFRVGMTGQWGSVTDDSPLSFRGRVNYSYQMGGNPYPVSRSRFIADPSVLMSVCGVDAGKHYLNLGVGMRWQFDPCRSFIADYDYNGSERSSGHYASLGFMQRW